MVHSQESSNSLPENRSYHSGQRSQPVQRPKVKCDPATCGKLRGHPAAETQRAEVAENGTGEGNQGTGEPVHVV